MVSSLDVTDRNGLIMEFPSLDGISRLFNRRNYFAKSQRVEDTQDGATLLSDYLNATGARRAVFPVPSPDEPVLCHVTLAKSPGDFHVRPAEWEEFVLGNLADALDEVYVGNVNDNPDHLLASPPPVHHLPGHQIRPGASCVVQHPTDGAFYRGLIVNAGFEGYRVQLGDFGDFVFADADRLFVAEEPFASFPPLSYGCALKGANDSCLTDEHCATFVQIVEDLKFELMVTFCGTKTLLDKRHEVLLHHPESGQDLGLEFIPKKSKKKRRRRKPKSQRRRVFEAADSTDEEEEEDTGDPEFSMQRDYDELFSENAELTTAVGSSVRIEELEDEDAGAAGSNPGESNNSVARHVQPTEFPDPLLNMWGLLKDIANIPFVILRWLFSVYDSMDGN